MEPPNDHGGPVPHPHLSLPRDLHFTPEGRPAEGVATCDTNAVSCLSSAEEWQFLLLPAADVCNRSHDKAFSQYLNSLKLLVSWWLWVLRLWPAVRVRSVTHRVKATSDDLCSVGVLPAACWPFVFVNVLGLRSPHSLHCLAGAGCREQVYLQKAHIKRAKVSKPMRMMSEISCVHVC